MNYAEARQMADTGRWHYTIRKARSTLAMWTVKDAYQCAHEFALKSAAAWEPWNFGGWRDCAVCGGSTRMGAMWDGVVPGWPETRALCSEHLTDEHVISQVEAPRYMAFS